jgi:DNA invertase Pin-like site-specific DNA recombinase
MKIGYARVSTKDQSYDLQVDALTEAGCTKIYKEVVSGAKSERVVLNEVLNILRPADVLVVWKLDRLGRSLKHLIELVNKLVEMNIGLQSLNDPVDTTSSHGRLIFNIFASLAEFERDIIRERTQAGLTAARSRGRMGGRPKGISKNAEAKTYAAAALYSEGALSVKEICQQIGISKCTLYNYLRHRGVKIGAYHRKEKIIK